MRTPLIVMSLLISAPGQAATPSESAHALAAPAAWQPDLGNGTYQNPVLFADYSDPDPMRVGEDYWLVSSSFSHVPGLPILHSRDLVNWELVNHALPTLSYVAGEPDHFNVPRHGAGVWAPSLRFHAGKYWIFFPDPDHGLFVVTATDPRGAWSAPVCVKAGKGLIDPCPLWDDDGKVYLIHGWAKSRSGKNNLITLNELSADATRVTDGEGVVIIDENNSSRGFHTLEGPKFYKRGDTYWIFAPIDGVANGAQAVYRSKTIRGPYDARVVLAQGSTGINGPHQGGWVDTPTGEHWFLHFQDRGPFGRVVHLEPMSWGSDGWPRMGTGVATGAEKGEPVLTHPKPKAGPALVTGPLAPATSDEFDSPKLGAQWQWQANPRFAFFALPAADAMKSEQSFVLRDALRLACVPHAAANLYDAPNLLLQKFPAPAFTATTELTLQRTGRAGDEAGLIVFGNSYAWIGLRRDRQQTHLVQRISVDANKSNPERETASVEVNASRAFLRVTVDASAKCRFSYSLDGKTFLSFGEEFQATVARWVGAKVGLFAAGAHDSEWGGQADFVFFHVTP